MMTQSDMIDSGLVLGATMRLTRAVVSDDIGAWWVKDPLDRLHHEGRLGHLDHKWLGGLECPYCVGFWIGAGVLATKHIAKATGLMGPWRFVTSALTLNEVAAHAGIALGDFN